jgi:hypothetical protein
MSDNPPPEIAPPADAGISASITNISGGVSLDAQRDINIGGDVVGRDKIIVIHHSSPDDERARRNRQIMIERVKHDWLTAEFESLLQSVPHITIEMIEQPSAVLNPWKKPTKLNCPLQSSAEIADLFDSTGKALLIMGEPGAGKSTLLCDLARAKINCAEQDPAQPIPVIFKLSSWANQRTSLIEWLIRELIDKYKIPEEIARSWVTHDDLLLLLDGLDEIRSDEQRKLCVAAINDFRASRGTAQIAVCTRTLDYSRLDHKLDLSSAVALQSLTPEQIDRYFEQAGTNLSTVRSVLPSDAILQAAVQTPLMLNVMTQAYRGLTREELQIEDETVDARQKHIFAAYMQNAFMRQTSDRPYTPADTLHWLTWLAQKMMQQSQSIFLIEQLQPSWLSSPADRERYGILVALLDGTLIARVIRAAIRFVLLTIVCSVLVNLLLRLISEPSPAAWYLGALVALANFLNDVIRTTRRALCPQDIRPVEALAWSWRRSARTLLIEILIIWGWTFAMFLLADASSIFFSNGPSAPMTFGTLLFTALITSLAALFIMLMVGLPIGVILGFFSGVSQKTIKTKVVPNQGIRQSARNALRICLVFVPVTLLASAGPWLVVGGIVPTYPLLLIFIDSVIGLYAALKFGGRAAIRHYALRWIMVRKGLLPWKIVDFLDYGAHLMFMEKRGAGYTFYHPLLMDYFASLDEDQCRMLVASLEQ